jgi:hypothetical protein
LVLFISIGLTPILFQGKLVFVEISWHWGISFFGLLSIILAQGETLRKVYLGIALILPSLKQIVLIAIY